MHLFNAACLVVFAGSTVFADEGMFPISELPTLPLRNKGFEIDSESIFNAGRPCLMDGICRVNTCTGSFISENGLIITNHHCAYEAIQNGSSPSNDLLSQGFIAKDRASELPAPGYTVRITQGYRDLSKEVLDSVQPGMSFLERTKAIDKRRKELEQAAEKERPGLRAEVAEMFTGKTYFLFFYTYLKDVRLVFAPPSSIGNFGGEIDNWEWPRHTGDFSFMRAYTAPDGSSAEYSPNNIPFRPKRPIRVEPKGVDEGDLVFLLGYPGRTVRHKTASFLQFERTIRLPLVVDSYRWQIATMEQQGQRGRDIAIKHSSRVKSLANVEKRSRGQLQGLARSNIVEQRAGEERELQAWIESDSTRKTKLGSVLSEIDSVYGEMSTNAPFELLLRELRTACRTLHVAFTVFDAANERAKEDLEREPPYMNRNFDQTRKQLMLDIDEIDVTTDKLMLAEMLQRLGKQAQTSHHRWLHSIVENRKTIDDSVDRWFKTSQLNNSEFVAQCLSKTPKELQSMGDPMMDFAVQLYPLALQHREIDKKREGQLNQLYGSWIDAKRSRADQRFVPDANSTLRLTFGRVRGDMPRDAVARAPLTTVRGILEKSTDVEPFQSPKVLLSAIERNERSPFQHPRLGQVPVAILYDADTTGGNSGSPVLNAKGDLIGVNFDRTFEATINDFAWNSAYSRSIGVDIRYVLWVTGVVFDGKHLLAEMGISR